MTSNWIQFLLEDFGDIIIVRSRFDFFPPRCIIKNELLLTVKYFLFTYWAVEKAVFSLKNSTKSSPFLHIKDLDKIYQIFVKVSSSCNRNRWVSEYKRKIFWICFDQSKLYLIQKNIMYKIAALLPLLFLGALAFPNNRYNEDGNKIILLGTLKLTITILLLR